MDIGEEKLPLITRDESQIRPYMKVYGENILGITRPASLGELRALVLEAGKANFTLHIHGFDAPGPVNYKNVLIVDLSALNRIVEVNKKSAYALVEPGVTYQQLYEYLQEKETGLWIDCDRNALNSVASSIASHEFGYTAYGDHMMMQCGSEVMLANGELVRLGMGALPGSNTWQLAKYALGPYVDGLFTQSNLGVITKIGVWLMPAPPAYKPFMLSLPASESIAAAMEILRDLKINVIIPNSVVISNALLDALPYINADDYRSESGTDVSQLKEDMNLGEWNLYGALYNTPDNVDVLWPMVSGALSSIEGSRLFFGEDRENDPVWRSREGLMRGSPSAEFDDLNNWHGEYRCDIGIACPPDGHEVLKLDSVIAEILQEHEVDNLSEYVVGWRSAIKRNYILFSDNEAKNIQVCIEKIITQAKSMGFGLSHFRSNHPQVKSHYAANKGMRVLQQSLKSALDPRQVLI